MEETAGFLYHYYEQSIGPFRNLSDLDPKEASLVMQRIRQKSGMMASRRDDDYLPRRRELEQLARQLFIAKGGKPIRAVPHYMVVGACDWLGSWYTDPAYVKVHVSEFPPDTLSFTYGDMFPTFSPRVNDGREYRGQVYTHEEIVLLIQKYGLPQAWNKDGLHGPERYIEVQVWDDEILAKAAQTK